jgi:hypothetical protein
METNAKDFSENAQNDARSGYRVDLVGAGGSINGQ